MNLMKHGGLVIIVIIAIAAIGSWIVLNSCPWGIGIGYDSYMYISTAESIAKGQGVYYRTNGNLHPLIHFPPLYPLVISVFLKSGLDRVASVTILAGLLLGLNTFVAGMLVFFATRKPLPAIAVAALMITSPVILDAHLLAMSEPLFYFFTLSYFVCMKKFFVNGKQTFLILSAILAASAIMTRYIGVVLMATGLLIIWIKKDTLKKKIFNTCLYFLISMIPISLWSYRNLTLGGSMTSRQFLFHLPHKSAWYLGQKTLSNWFISSENYTIGRISGFVFFLALVCLIIAIWFWLKPHSYNIDHHQQKNIKIMVIILLSFSIFYIVFLFISLTFFDASTKLNNRILSPLYINFLLLPCLIAPCLKYPQRYCLASLLLIWTGFNISQSQFQLAVMRTQGQGFNSKSWLSFPTVDYVRKLQENVIIYSNESLPLEFLTSVPVLPVPEEINSLIDKKNADFDSRIKEFQNDMSKPRRILIVFSSNYRPELPEKRELVRGLIQIENLTDGQIFINPNNLDSITLPQK